MAKVTKMRRLVTKNMAKMRDMQKAQDMVTYLQAMVQDDRGAEAIASDEIARHANWALNEVSRISKQLKLPMGVL